jgi:hypothetical protein
MAKEKLYTARSLPAAKREVRALRKSRRQLTELLDRVYRERNLLAMMAADGPAFRNPLLAAEAKNVRDMVLRQSCRLNPDGSPLK